MWCFFKSMSQTSCSISINLEPSPLSSHLEPLGKMLSSIPRLSFLSHLLIYFIGVCVHMSCIHAWVCSIYMCRCVCLWLFIWRSEISVGHLPLIFSTLFFESESPTEPGAQCWCKMDSQGAHDPLVSTLLCRDYTWVQLLLTFCLSGIRTKVLMLALQELYSPRHLSTQQSRMTEMKESTDREMLCVQGLQELILFKSPSKVVFSSSPAKLYG